MLLVRKIIILNHCSPIYFKNVILDGFDETESELNLINLNYTLPLKIMNKERSRKCCPRYQNSLVYAHNLVFMDFEFSF